MTPLFCLTDNFTRIQSISTKNGMKLTKSAIDHVWLSPEFETRGKVLPLFTEKSAFDHDILKFSLKIKNPPKFVSVSASTPSRPEFKNEDDIIEANKMMNDVSESVLKLSPNEAYEKIQKYRVSF